MPCANWISHAAGSLELRCQPCDQGLYQNSTASSSCLVCPSERTTQLLGATSLGDCVCQENMRPGCGSGHASLAQD